MKPVTEAWLIKAGEDLDAIRALRGNPQLTGVVADQFTEALDIDLLHELTDVYTDCRYPGDLGFMPSGKPTEEDAARFEQFSDHVHATVLSFLS